MTVANTLPYTLETRASLAPFNSLRVQAEARQLARLHDAQTLPDLLAKLDHRPLLLGGGSNILFTHDYAGSIVLMANRGVSIEETEDAWHLAVAAGEIWDDFVRWTLGQGFAGLENLILIPGSVGAAPIQNIGAYGVEVQAFIESVETWDTKDNKVAILDHKACQFGYRDSLFKHQPDRYIITAVRFRLPKQHELQLDYHGLQQQLERMSVHIPSVYHVAEAVQTLRTRKLPDPAIIGNAGSFFKNPMVSYTTAQELFRSYPNLRHWPMPDGQIKLSAAALIESVGLKGYRIGDAGISHRHALVLVNHGHASGRQLWDFAQQVIAKVEAFYGIRLHPEPRIID